MPARRYGPGIALRNHDAPMRSQWTRRYYWVILEAMRQTLAIHAALKRLLKARGRTYAEAATVLELSEASVKRLFARGELALDRIERLCVNRNPNFPTYGNRKFPTRFRPRPLPNGPGRP